MMPSAQEIRTHYLGDIESATATGFIDTLDGSRSFKHPVLMQEVGDRLAERSSVSLSYSAPLRQAALLLADVVVDGAMASGRQSRQELIEVLADCGEWGLRRLLETARFVLHVEHTRSNLAYSAWCSTFEDAPSGSSPWRSIAKEYPVLLRWLQRIHENTEGALLEMMQRLEGDRTVIEEVLSIPASGGISSIYPGLSDPHRGGRSVIRLRFSTGQYLIYKPKSLELDCAVFELVRCIQPNLGIVPLRVISRDGYGWSEDVTDRLIRIPPTNVPDAVASAASLFWLINASDLHSENVVATAEGAYVLDLETVLQPGGREAAASGLSSWRNHSVYTTLLFDFSFGDSRAPNVSGFCSTPNIVSLSTKVEFEIIDDVVKLKVVPRPVLGTFVPPGPRQQGHASRCPITDAFRALASNDGFLETIKDWLSKLAHKTVARIVFRDTEFYGRILDRLRQPRLLRDPVATLADLSRLHEGVEASATLGSDKIHSLVEDEIRQLLKGDIPYFSYEIGGLDLNCSEGPVSRFFSKSGVELTRQKLECLGTSDIEEQAALIELAIGVYAPKHAAGAEDYCDQSSCKPASQETRADLLRNLAFGIVDAAFEPEESPARWISLFGDVAGQASRVEVGEDSYFSGSWGILLALQAVANSLRDGQHDLGHLDRFLDRQSRILRLRPTSPDAQETLRVLGFSGLGGELLAKARLLSADTKRWGFLEAHVASSLSVASKQVDADRHLDVIGGAAGLALACQSILCTALGAKCHQYAVEVLELCVAKLLSLAIEVGDRALAWSVPGEREPLLGYAHGWAGIFTALAQSVPFIRHEAQRKELVRALGRASEFPLEHLKRHGTWLDLRAGGQGRKALNRSWCNGSPGLFRGLIAAAPYRSGGSIPEVDQLQMSIEDQVGATSMHRFCCGELGSADLLLDLCQAAPTEQRSRLAQRSASIAVDNALLACSTARPHSEPEIVLPGLFHGVSGIAYVAARLMSPGIPSLSGQLSAEQSGGAGRSSPWLPSSTGGSK